MLEVGLVMALDNKASEHFGEEHTGFVPAVFARSAEEAEQYSELLNDHDIPTIVGMDEDPSQDNQCRKVVGKSGMTHGVPVLVPDVLLDEASEIIANREDLDEFKVAEEQLEDDEDEVFGLHEEIDPKLQRPLEEEEDEDVSFDNDNTDEPEDELE